MDREESPRRSQRRRGGRLFGARDRQRTAQVIQRCAAASVDDGVPRSNERSFLDELLDQAVECESTTSVEGNTVTTRESDQAAEETGRTASKPEPGSMTRPVPERVQDPMPVQKPTDASETTPVLDDLSAYEERWNTIQTNFVDEPRHAVQSADRLVTEAMEDRARVIVSHRDSLQSQWRQNDHIDTERLRLVFQEYRTFLHGLLSA